MRKVIEPRNFRVTSTGGGNSNGSVRRETCDHEFVSSFQDSTEGVPKPRVPRYALHPRLIRFRPVGAPE